MANIQNRQQASAPASAEAIEAVLVSGDLKGFTAEQRVIYYKQVCESVGLNPLTRPFEYVTFQGKMVLYARKDATEQIRANRGVSLRITARELMDDVYVVTAEAQDKAGRVDSATGAVSVQGLKGEAKANALMKAETKAKRRVTLSIAGLGLLDETEVETIPGARPFDGSHAPTPHVENVPRIEAEEGDWMAGDSVVPIDGGQLAVLLEDIASSGMDSAVILSAYRIKDLSDLPADKFEEACSRIAAYVARREAKREAQELAQQIVDRAAGVAP